jgi:hypothetical protein
MQKSPQKIRASLYPSKKNVREENLKKKIRASIHPMRVNSTIPGPLFGTSGYKI